MVHKRSDFKNEINSLLNQNGVTYDGSLRSEEGREFLRELTLDDAAELLLEQWLEAIDEFTVKIKRMQRWIEEVATEWGAGDVTDCARNSTEDAEVYALAAVHTDTFEVVHIEAMS